MYKKVLALVLAAVLLSGCDRGGENADSNVFSESSSSPINSDISSEPTSDSSENSAPVKAGGIPEKISDYINSLDNGDFVFVDYTFNEDPELITFIPSLNNIYGKALAALQEIDDYKNFTENYGSAELFGRFTEKAEDYLDQNGEPMPVFKRAITDDFDEDGADESFVMMAIAKIPDDNREERWFEREYLFFVNEDGAVLIDDYFDAQISAVLDYGCCKQLIVASEGWSGTDSKSNIWGVKKGNAVKLYGGRLSYEKSDCFLYSFGAQSIGDFMLYDTDKGEYLAIQGKELTAEDIHAMDTDNVIGSEYDNIVNAVLIGGKYYVINKNGVYTYENGRFEISDKKVRSSDTPGITGNALNTLDDVDYDAALASMIAPEENKSDPVVNDWKQMVLVDYTLEKDPKSADAEEAAEYISKAEEELLRSDTYKQSAEHFTIDVLSSEKQLIENPERFFGEDGKLRPIFKCAFVDDFDNNGTEEAFVALSMPTLEFTGERTFLFLVNADGAKPVPDELIHFHGDNTFYLLDYGCCKHLAISTNGDLGVDRRSMIIGVSGGKAEVLFAQRSCVLRKYGPFLATDDAQFDSYYGFFDAKTRKYYSTFGKQLAPDEIKAMDTSDSIAASGETLDNFVVFHVIGGKYYYFIGMLGHNALFTYEDGTFTKLDSNEYAFRPSVDTFDMFSKIPDIDYDAAMTSMIAPENIRKNSTSSNVEHTYQLYEEVFLNQQLLESIEQDRLDVKVNLHIDAEALRAEYEERYPELAEDYYSWGRFLSSSGDQVISEFVRDYDIDYEELESVFKMGATFYYELDKDTISSMLNDSRVAEIIYSVGGFPVIVDF